MTRYLAMLTMVLAVSACSSRITGLGTVFPDMEGMRAIMFGDQASRAEALSPDRAGLAAKACLTYVVDGLNWDTVAGRIRAVKGARPLFHDELFPESVWSVQDVPLVFSWPLSVYRGCVIAIFSGDREESIRAIVAEVEKKMNARSINIDQAVIEGLTFADVKEARTLQKQIASGRVSYHVSARLVELDDPFATSGAGVLLSLWRRDTAGADGQS